jgi:hypothetical protein
VNKKPFPQGAILSKSISSRKVTQINVLNFSTGVFNAASDGTYAHE